MFVLTEAYLVTCDECGTSEYTACSGRDPLKDAIAIMVSLGWRFGEVREGSDIIAYCPACANKEEAK